MHSVIPVQIGIIGSLGPRAIGQAHGSPHLNHRSQHNHHAFSLHLKSLTHDVLFSGKGVHAVASLV